MLVIQVEMEILTEGRLLVHACMLEFIYDQGTKILVKICFESFNSLLNHYHHISSIKH